MQSEAYLVCYQEEAAIVPRSIRPLSAETRTGLRNHCHWRSDEANECIPSFSTGFAIHLIQPCGTFIGNNSLLFVSCSHPILKSKHLLQVGKKRDNYMWEKTDTFSTSA